MSPHNCWPRRNRRAVTKRRFHLVWKNERRFKAKGEDYITFSQLHWRRLSSHRPSNIKTAISQEPLQLLNEDFIFTLFMPTWMGAETLITYEFVLRQNHGMPPKDYWVGKGVAQHTWCKCTPSFTPFTTIVRTSRIHMTQSSLRIIEAILFRPRCCTTDLAIRLMFTWEI